MISGTVDLSRQESVPHRWHVLEVLRAMRRGHPFIRLPGGAGCAHLEGVPLAVHFFGFLERNAYIVPCAEKGLKAHYYTLNSDGITLHEEGERWWGTLRWREKLWIVLWG